MKLVIVADIHGNPDALRALPEDYDELWVLGARVNGFSVRAASIRACITCDMMPRRHGDSIEYHRNSPEISGVIGDRDVPCGFAAIRGTLFDPADQDGKDCPSPCDKLARRAKFRFTETPNQ